jgi:hypothetical protein
MALQRLNPNNAEFADARGINPPLVRCAAHIGFAFALTGKSSDAEWTENKTSVKEELDECIRHLQANTDFEPTPFIGQTAIDKLGDLRAQFNGLTTDMDGLERLEMFTELATLANNLAYVSAFLERAVTGNDADEGRNP